MYPGLLEGFFFALALDRFGVRLRGVTEQRGNGKAEGMFGISLAIARAI